MQANEELSDKTRRRKVDQLLSAEAAPRSHYGQQFGGGRQAYPDSESFFYENYTRGSGRTAASRTYQQPGEMLSLFQCPVSLVGSQLQ